MISDNKMQILYYQWIMKASLARMATGSMESRSHPISYGRKKSCKGIVQNRNDRLFAQITKHSMSATKTREDHCIHTLPGEGAIPHTVEALQTF